MVTTSSTPTTLDRDASSGTTATNTTASTRNSASTNTSLNSREHNYASTRSNTNTDNVDNDDDDVFIDRTAAAQYDSMLAESIIRIRSQLHRDESSRASLTLSQSSAELFSSNEFDSSTISSAMTRPPLMNFTSSTVTVGDVQTDPDVASSSLSPTTEPETCDTKEKERAVLRSGAPQPQDEVSTIPDGLNTSMDLISKKRVIPTVQESIVPVGMTAQNLSLCVATSMLTMVLEAMVTTMVRHQQMT